MNKRYLHHTQTKLRHIKPWYFLVIAIFSGVLCVFALRANNEHMLVLREAVFVADRNNTDVQKPLQELQAYVTTHMNTNLSIGQNPVYPPIQLQHTYQRLMEARRQAASEANSKLYSEAQAFCEQQNPASFYGGSRIPCIQQYVQSKAPQQVAEVPEDLYKFAFVSPRWSPDLAGWSMVVTILASVLFIVLLVTRWLLRRITR